MVIFSFCIPVSCLKRKKIDKDEIIKADSEVGSDEVENFKNKIKHIIISLSCLILFIINIEYTCS